ncbi:MAG: leukotoxin LktA family filamentous adhesin, partial [Megasphaera sp.]|nr:leukotoxin LktA family filamentous adhesin [Megasphaera sp.]
MSYLRQFTRKNERSYTKERTKQQNTTMLRRKVISSVTALGFMFNPVAALAADVTQITGSDQKPINGSSPVTNIYVQKMLDGNVTGINTFDQFSLKANDIANLYFNQQGHETTATNLVNLVNKRIDISGTVNAVKNNTIGGNLFFLSSNGMAVSKTGVINAGSLTVLTPTTAAFDNLMQTTGN